LEGGEPPQKEPLYKGKWRKRGEFDDVQVPLPAPKKSLEFYLQTFLLIMFIFRLLKKY